MAKKAKVGRLAVYNEGNGVEFIVAITEVSSFSFSGVVIYVMPDYAFYEVGHTSSDWTRNGEFFEFTTLKKFDFLNI